MPSKVIDIDKGYKKLMDTLYDLSVPQYVAVGIQGQEAFKEEHDGSPLSNVEIGTIHEYGAPDANIPERSFIRAALDELVAQGKIEKFMTKGCKAIIDKGKTREQVLGLLGQLVKGRMQKRMTEGIPPPLAESTVLSRTKGKDPSIGYPLPLLDTGQLRASITSVVKLGEVGE